MAHKPKVNIPEEDASEYVPVVPLTRAELQRTAKARIEVISKEFSDGFTFLEKYPKSVTIFGGSHFKEDSEEYIRARSLGGRIVKDLKYAVFTGGGPGIMEAANRGAFEAGGDSLGLTIELAEHQIQNDYLTKYINFYYFFTRKMCLAFSAEAYIFCPGGYGTLDEFFEIITLVQTKKVEKVPVILYGSAFWKPLDELMKKEMLSRGTIDKEDVSLYKITDDEDEIIDLIKHAPVHNGIKFNTEELIKHGIKVEE